MVLEDGSYFGVVVDYSGFGKGVDFWEVELDFCWLVIVAGHKAEYS